jgi:hypothetical protein
MPQEHIPAAGEHSLCDHIFLYVLWHPCCCCCSKCGLRVEHGFMATRACVYCSFLLLRLRSAVGMLAVAVSGCEGFHLAVARVTVCLSVTGDSGWVCLVAARKETDASRGPTALPNLQFVQHWTLIFLQTISFYNIIQNARVGCQQICRGGNVTLLKRSASRCSV